MESFDNTNANIEPSPEELGRLLGESHKWISKIIEEHNSEENIHAATVPATTAEAEDDYKIGEISVEDFSGNEFIITLNESDYTASGTATAEHFKLSIAYGTGKYELLASGVQPDVMEEVADDDASEEEYEKALAASEEYLSQQLRPASPAEIQRLAYVLEIGAFGDVPFYFEHFEIDYHKHLNELEMAKRTLNENEDNENHPE